MFSCVWCLQIVQGDGLDILLFGDAQSKKYHAYVNLGSYYDLQLVIDHKEGC